MPRRLLRVAAGALLGGVEGCAVDQRREDALGEPYPLVSGTLDGAPPAPLPALLHAVGECLAGLVVVRQAGVGGPAPPHPAPRCGDALGIEARAERREGHPLDVEAEYPLHRGALAGAIS